MYKRKLRYEAENNNLNTRGHRGDFHSLPESAHWEADVKVWSRPWQSGGARFGEPPRTVLSQCRLCSKSEVYPLARRWSYKWTRHKRVKVIILMLTNSQKKTKTFWRKKLSSENWFKKNKIEELWIQISRYAKEKQKIHQDQRTITKKEYSNG